MELHVRVYGRPAPQGSHETGANGRLLDSSKYLAKWREKVNFAVRRAYLDAGIGPADMPLFPAPRPVYVMITHYVMPEQCRAAGTDDPTGRPDFDKLLRATVDGLGDARAFTEDSQITDAITGKTRAGEAGAEIIISDRLFWRVIREDEQVEQGQYRLTLEKVGTNEDGDRSWENVIEVTDSPDGIVNAWLPTVSMRLGGAGMLQSLQVLPSIPDVPASNPISDAAQKMADALEAPKRKRRTKAEIAADEQAQAAGFRDAAHQAQAIADAAPREVTIPVPVPADPAPAPQYTNPFAAMSAG